ncbi:alpha/beta fold hydrolase [Pseudonocardiaceae bacterium YIM PH 21723]|nr:alpha/beta fold hydrolase [Pseudonocardiaceae bacterium YIM PH 21723]
MAVLIIAILNSAMNFVALAMAGTIAMTGLPAAAAATSYRPVIVWGQCEVTQPPFKPGAECGTLEVPVDWDRPDGEKTKLAVSRVKATGNRLGVLVWGPGGPGLRGTNAGISTFFNEDVSAAYDVVGYDPRGLNPGQVRCTEPDIKAVQLPTTEQEFQQRVEYNRQVSESCRAQTGALFDHLDSISDARDMEALRIALGEQVLNYDGGSYGTMRGQLYPQLFPDRVGRWVNDSNMDHSLRTGAQFITDVTLAVEQNLKDWSAWYRKTNGGNGDVLIHRARAKVALAKDPRLMESLLSDLTILSSNPSQWPDLTTVLDARAYGGDLGQPADPVRFNPVAQAIYCSDWNVSLGGWSGFQKLRRELGQKAPRIQIGWQTFNSSLSVLGCQGWTGKVGNPRRDLAKLDRPGVSVNIRHDVRTPYTWGETAAKQSGAFHLADEGYGHIAHTPSSPGDPKSCISEQLDTYLLTGRLPTRSSCPAME